MPYYDQYKNTNFTGGVYPNLYLVDDFGEVGNEEVELNLSISPSSHGSQTIETIKSIANHTVRPNLQIYKSNIIRNYDSLYPSKNIIEALFSVLILNTLKIGDILIANVETESRVSTSLNGNSIITDKVCKDILLKLSKIGIIVIVPAGNHPLPIDDSDLADMGDIIVVGSFKNLTPTTFKTSNRFSEKITCFAEDRITIGANIFTDTSAATAQIAGFVMQMQKYAKSQGSFLTPKEVKQILKTMGDKINISAIGVTIHNCNVPTWATVATEIDRILPRPFGPAAP